MYIHFTRSEAAQLIDILDYYSNNVSDELSRPLAWHVFDALHNDMEKNCENEE